MVGTGSKAGLVISQVPCIFRTNPHPHPIHVNFNRSSAVARHFRIQGKLNEVLKCTVEPRFNEPLFNEVLDITNDILCPGQSYSKIYGIQPRYNEPRYNEFFDITNIIRKPKRKIYLDITNYNVNTRQKINAEQINSQQIL